MPQVVGGLQQAVYGVTRLPQSVAVLVTVGGPAGWQLCDVVAVDVVELLVVGSVQEGVLGQVEQSTAEITLSEVDPLLAEQLSPECVLKLLPMWLLKISHYPYIKQSAI